MLLISFFLVAGAVAWAGVAGGTAPGDLRGRRCTGKIAKVESKKCTIFLNPVKWGFIQRFQMSHQSTG